MHHLYFRVEFIQIYLACSSFVLFTDYVMPQPTIQIFLHGQRPSMVESTSYYIISVTVNNIVTVIIRMCPYLVCLSHFDRHVLDTSGYLK